MTQPVNLLMEFVLSLLVPFLTTGSLTDATLARRAAEETIAAYKTAGHDQLVTVAQLVGFALTALDSLRLSIPPDLSLSMKLKLRGNANALNRTSQRATVELDRQRHAVPPPPPELESPLDQAEVLASLAAAKAVVQQAVAARNSEIAAARANPAPPSPAPTNPTPATPAPTRPAPIAAAPQASQPAPPKTGLPPVTNRDSDLAWAAGMARVASRLTAELAELPPEEQQLQLMRINVLSQVSGELGRGDPPSLKSRLFATTTLVSDRGDASVAPRPPFAG